MPKGANSLSTLKIVQWLISRRQLLLVLMFGFLHLRLMQVVPGLYGRVPLLLHFALFLLWQPFINARSTVGAPHLVWIVIGILVTSFGATWSLLAVWLVLLAGIVGGRVFFFSQGKTKWFYLMALAYLILMLLFQVVPLIIPESVEGRVLMSFLAGYGGLVLLVFMALLPESQEQDTQREAIDLIYSLLLILILAVLVLGTISLMPVRQIGYIQALLTSMFAAAATLLAASWLWNPVGGFSRLGAMASRYMLSIGLPFEQWLHSLNELAEQEEDPERFLDNACRSMVEQLPWVKACTWSVGAARSDIKTQTATRDVETVFRQGELALTLTTRQAISPVMVWHFNLVTQLVTRFYVEKSNSRRLREMAYMQAIHETGARVTHDVKNLLQSLHALMFAIGGNGDEFSPKAQPLLRRQLPLIVQRMQQTLDKLQAPEDSGLEGTISAAAWWRELQARYDGRGIQFELHGGTDGAITAGLFTSAAENLLQNALEKRAIEPGIAIAVVLDMRNGQAVLSVRDNGSALPPQRARDIGRRPLASENGLGIGLYQLARLAGINGYALSLDTNSPGAVVFSLRPEAWV